MNTPWSQPFRRLVVSNKNQKDGIQKSNLSSHPRPVLILPHLIARKPPLLLLDFRVQGTLVYMFPMEIQSNHKTNRGAERCLYEDVSRSNAQ